MLLNYYYIVSTEFKGGIAESENNEAIFTDSSWLLKGFVSEKEANSFIKENNLQNVEVIK